MRDEGFKDKKECDLYSKEVKDKKDKDLYKRDYKSRDLGDPEFVLEKEDLDDGGTKNLRVWGEGSVSWGRNNSTLLICQYQIIIK